jgi:hypothetical protein
MKRDTKEDLKNLAQAFFDNLEFDDTCESGSIGVDCKRPFGNSNVAVDILEIIGWEPEDKGDYSEDQRDYAWDLYRHQLTPYLKKEWERLNKINAACK